MIKQKKIKKFVISITLIILFILNVFFKFIQVEGNSMYPTIKSGTILVICKKNLFFKEIYRDDIIVFRRKNNQYIKRVVAIKGDVISSEEGKLKIGNKLYENYSYIGDDIILDDGEFFVIGDNAAKSIDSRNFGVIYLEEIIGKCMR